MCAGGQKEEEEEEEGGGWLIRKSIPFSKPSSAMHTSIDAVYVFPPPHTLSQTHTYVIKQRHSYEYTHMLRRSCDEGAEMSLVVWLPCVELTLWYRKYKSLLPMRLSLSLSLPITRSLFPRQTHTPMFILVRCTFS